MCYLFQHVIDVLRPAPKKHVNSPQTGFMNENSYIHELKHVQEHTLNTYAILYIYMYMIITMNMFKYMYLNNRTSTLHTNKFTTDR